MWQLQENNRTRERFQMAEEPRLQLNVAPITKKRGNRWSQRSLRLKREDQGQSAGGVAVMTDGMPSRATPIEIDLRH